MKRFINVLFFLLPVLLVFFAVALPMLKDGAAPSVPGSDFALPEETTKTAAEVTETVPARHNTAEITTPGASLPETTAENAGEERIQTEPACTQSTESTGQKRAEPDGTVRQTVTSAGKTKNETTREDKTSVPSSPATTAPTKSSGKNSAKPAAAEAGTQAPLTTSGGKEKEISHTAEPSEPSPSTHPTAVMSTTKKTETVTQMLAFGRKYTNALASSAEMHVYTFAATERGVIRYSVTHKKAENYGGWTLTLYQLYSLDGVGEEKGRRVLNVLRSTQEGTTDSSVSIGVMPGDYLITVEPSSSNLTTQEYTLQADFTPCTDHEIECNDTLSRYTELYTGVPVTGSASFFDDRQDTDVYLLRLPKQGYINLTFTHPDMNGVTVCWKLTVTNADGREVYSENSTLSTTKLSSGRLGLKAGNYFITVSTRVHTSCDYVLKVTRTSSDNYETERNDQKSTADVLKTNTAKYGAMTSKSGAFDTDWYKFTVKEAGYVSLTFSHAADKDGSDKNGWRVRLLDSSGKCVYSVISGWAQAKNTSPTLGLAKGTYYVTVDCGDLFRNTAVYTLNVKFTASDAWETENNGSFAAADKLTVGKGTSAAITAADTVFDEDYFTFTLTEKSSVDISLLSSKSAIKKKIYRLTLFDKDKKEVAVSGAAGKTSADCTGAATTTVGYKQLPAGKYYIKVTAGLYYDTHKYTVTVNK